MAVKINSFEIENTKRIKLLQYEPSATGLTVIGGKNNQGKTSVLDAIAWTLGGDRFKPTAAQRDGALVPPHLKVELSNGIIVERKGKNSDLKVTDPSGRLAGQTLLNRFVESFALNVPKFMESSDKEKAQTLLQIIGVGDQLFQLERDEVNTYNQRHTIGQIADQKKKYAKEMPQYQGVPAEPISAFELIQQQQAILARNGENQRKRAAKDRFEKELEDAEAAFEAAKAKLSQAKQNYKIASEDAADLQDESTAELEASINEVDEINRKIRANLDKAKAEMDADEYQKQYDALTDTIENIRKTKLDLLNGADLPLPELSVEDGELTYKGKRWDSMSGSQQLQVATAIVRKLNPECGFVLLDKLEQFDPETLAAFGEWLQQEDLQAIATRVSTGEECSIIIEDGMIAAPAKRDWKEGF